MKIFSLILLKKNRLFSSCARRCYTPLLEVEGVVALLVGVPPVLFTAYTNNENKLSQLIEV
jgi:hypothetical protein